MDFKKLILLVGIVGILASCNSKKDDPKVAEPLTNFIYNGVEGDISQATLDYYGQLDKGEGYNFDLLLYSEPISISFNNDGDIIINGNGSFFYLELFSPSTTELAVGEYIYTDDYQPNTFDYGFFVYNYDETIEDSEVTQGIVGGKLTVTEVSGNNYKLNFDFILEDGDNVSGTYEGEIPITDQENSQGLNQRKNAFNKKEGLKRQK